MNLANEGIPDFVSRLLIGASKRRISLVPQIWEVICVAGPQLPSRISLLRPSKTDGRATVAPTLIDHDVS